MDEDGCRHPRSREQEAGQVEALRRFIEAYEAEHGELTEAEVEMAMRSARERAVVVRGKPDST